MYLTVMYTKIGNEKKKTWNLSLPGKYELREADVIVLIPAELKCKAETLSGMNKVVEEWQTMIH